MNPELAETIYVDFVTSSPTTGAAIDADSTPTAEVFEDATDTAILSPTITKRTGKTGNYRVPVACTAANGFEVGKSYNVTVSATVGAVAAKASILTFQVRAIAVAGASQASVDAIAAKTNNLPPDPADASDIAASFAGLNTKVDSVKVKTDNLPVDPADASDIAASFAGVNTKLDSISTGLPLDTTELNAIADAVLARDVTLTAGEAAYSLLNAIRMLRCKWTTEGGILTVYEEDGTTVAWTRTLSVDAAAVPIVGAS